MGDNETPRHGLEHGHEAMQVYAETLCRHALDAQRAIWPAIESIVRARPCWGSPAVIEGWAILPDLFIGGPARRGRLLGFSPTSQPLTRRVCMDRDFYRGASDEAALITKFVERSARYDAALEHAARTSKAA